MGWCGRATAWLMLGVVGLAPAALWAQDKPEPQNHLESQIVDEPIHTLHVYMDLIQVPVLVLDSDRERMKPIEASHFLVSLDAGPTFHPKHVRQQGDDPITLGILLDLNSEPDVVLQMAKAIPHLAPDSLHSKDHVTLFSLDCALTRALRDAPADPEVLKTGVDHALQPWIARHKEKHVAPCDKQVRLWDAMAFIVNELGALPGRRILLAATDGVDGGSSTKWNDLREFAQQKGVAIFGYSQTHGNVSTILSSTGASGGRASRTAPVLTSIGSISSAEDPLDAICQLSGGMVMHAEPSFVAKELVKFTTLVRERYIIEFSRPRNGTPGEHNIFVTIPRKSPHAYIRPAGVTILPEAAQANDPTTIPRDASDAPEIGNRKVLKPSPR